MADEVWYYGRDGQQFGPLTEDALRDMAARGQLMPQDLVWREGMENWQPAHAVPGLMPMAAPPPQPQQPTMGYYAPQQSPLNYYAPEGVNYHYAGFWIRFVAAFVDGVITGAGGFVIGGIVGFIIGASMAGSGANAQAIQAVSGIVGNILGQILSWLYEALMTSSSKQATLGKMAVGIKVVDEYGQRISFGRATGRYFAKILSALTLLIGYIIAGFTQRKQALHDFIAKTYVIYA